MIVRNCNRLQKIVLSFTDHYPRFAKLSQVLAWNIGALGGATFCRDAIGSDV
jgi:hypothetical protein